MLVKMIWHCEDSNKNSYGKKNYYSECRLPFHASNLPKEFVISKLVVALLNADFLPNTLP